MNIKSKDNHSVCVMITGTRSCNNLGVIRGLGRNKIPTILLNVDNGSMVRYSKYITKNISCPDPNESEIEFINFLLDISKNMSENYVIIPTADSEVMTLSKYKKELESFYFLPISSFEITQKLVDKKQFYKLLDLTSVPHPKTYFPNDISDVKRISNKITYPYLVKPIFSTNFGKEFGLKSFEVNSAEELVQSYQKAVLSGHEVVIQEVIPGNEIYMFYTYFDKKSEPLAICGYDKLRQYPPDFGCGSLCRSSWRSGPINSAIQLLQDIKYHGIAEPEFKKDPRDGIYKLLEINARTSTENRLPAKCGVDIEYIAYLDITGQYTKTPVYPNNGILWVDEFYDFLSCLLQLKNKRLGGKELLKSLRGEKEYAVFARDDPIPCIIFPINISSMVLKFLLKQWNLRLKLR